MLKGKYEYLNENVITYLDAECPKDEAGKREESYSAQIMRLIKALEARNEESQKA